ncbi:unnamed protein product [Diamesa tonsa]
MLEEETDDVLQEKFKSLVSCVKSSCNTNLCYSGNSMNNTNNINYTLNFTSQSNNDKQHDSSTTTIRTAKIEDQKIEVFAKDKKIFKLIWNYLSTEDKLKCTRVCKRFNDIISEMDVFRLRVYFRSMVHIIPKLTRKYTTVTFQNYQCYKLHPLMHQMLKQLGHSVIDLRFNNCKFNLMTLYAFLCEFPLLESLELNMTLIMKDGVELAVENIPKLWQLRDFKIKVNSNLLNETLDIMDSSSSIESLSLVDVTLDFNVFNDYLRKFESSLQSLSLTKCIINKVINISDLNTLKLYSIKQIPPQDYNIFDCMKNLRFIHLIEVNTDLLNILDTKCMNWVTELEVIYTTKGEQNMGGFYLSYTNPGTKPKEIFDRQELASESLREVLGNHYFNTIFRNNIKLFQNRIHENVFHTYVYRDITGYYETLKYPKLKSGILKDY